jgi:hypothetical protein
MMSTNFRSWHFSDMLACPLRDRYRGQSGHRESCTQKANLIITHPRNFPIRRPIPCRVADSCKIPSAFAPQ